MFFDRYSELCRKKGVSCNQAALEIGLSNAAAPLWRKRGSTPDGKTLARIADYFGVSTDYLLERDFTFPSALSAEALAVAEAFDAADERTKEIIRLTLQDLLAPPASAERAI